VGFALPQPVPDLGRDRADVAARQTQELTVAAGREAERGQVGREAVAGQRLVSPVAMR
jgi:hypothetical protein